MSGINPESIRAEAILDDPETIEVGSHKPLRSGSSVGGLIPAKYAELLRVREAEEIKCYINYDLGIVIHEIDQE